MKNVLATLLFVAISATYATAQEKTQTVGDKSLETTATIKYYGEKNTDWRNSSTTNFINWYNKPARKHSGLFVNRRRRRTFHKIVHRTRNNTRPISCKTGTHLSTRTWKGLEQKKKTWLLLADIGTLRRASSTQQGDIRTRKRNRRSNLRISRKVGGI